jgi:hypothetical protein
MTVFDRIRHSCRQVAQRARFVRIAADRIEAYARSLPLAYLERPELDPRYHLIGAPKETLAYIIILDTVNFGSGYFPHLQKRPGLSGYFTIASALKDYFEAYGPPDAETLVRLTPADCHRIFGQEPDEGPRSELMALFARALNDLGRLLVGRFDGNFTRLVAAAGGRAERLVYILAEMPFFRDVASYDGVEVYFYKRAQLTCADLWLASGGAGYGYFADIDDLTIFADNMVPHVLRVDGVLVYDQALADRIDRGELIPAGSPEEVEIRACAVHAAELIVAELRQAGRPITARELDYLLWNLGQEPKYKAWPRHRTRTVFY